MGGVVVYLATYTLELLLLSTTTTTATATTNGGYRGYRAARILWIRYGIRGWRPHVQSEWIKRGRARARARNFASSRARLLPLPHPFPHAYLVYKKYIRIYSACLVHTAFVSCPGSIFIVARGGAVDRERRRRRWPTEREEREDWPNGIGEPDRRRLADTALYSGLERCPLAYRTVVLAVFFSLGVVDCVLLFHLPPPPPPRSCSHSRRCRPASRKTPTAASVLREKKKNKLFYFTLSTACTRQRPLNITTYRVIFYY